MVVKSKGILPKTPPKNSGLGIILICPVHVLRNTPEIYLSRISSPYRTQATLRCFFSQLTFPGGYVCFRKGSLYLEDHPD